MEIDLNDVAKYQRRLIFAILLQVGMFIYMIYGAPGLLATDAATTVAMIENLDLGPLMVDALIGLVSLTIDVTSMTFVVLLLTAMQRPIISRVLAAISMLMPVVGLIVLLVINGRAIKLLQADRYRVARMRAKSK